MSDRPCLCTPDYRCASHYSIDPRLEFMAKNFAITDATWRRWLAATGAGVDAGIAAMTEHIDTAADEPTPDQGA